MKQLGVSVKQESSVIKKEKKKRQKEENKDYHGRCWLGPWGRVRWWRLFAFFCHLGGQLLITEAAGEEVIYNSAVYKDGF